MDKLELYTKLIQNSKLKRVEPLKGLILELEETFVSGFFSSVNFTYRIKSLPISYFFHTLAIENYLIEKMDSISRTVSKQIGSNIFILYGDEKYTRYTGKLFMSDNVKKQIQKEFDSIKELTEKYDGHTLTVEKIEYEVKNTTLNVYVYPSDVWGFEPSGYLEFDELDEIYDIFNERIPDFFMKVFLK